MTQNSNQPSGFKCPVCPGFIPTSAMELLTHGFLVCPHCKLQLIINKEASKVAIAALENVQVAQNNVDNASVFKR